MNIFQCARAYVLRKPMKSIVLCIIFIIIFLGELVGISVYSIAEKGEKDAFLYQGAALSIESEDGDLTAEMYEKITSIEHVIGVNNWRENLVVPVGMNNVKQHTGVEPGADTEDVTWNTNSVVLLSMMNTELYPWFRYEKSVSLINGTYPSYENQGIIIENKFAEQNNLSLGDDVTFAIEESGNEHTYKVCGIFQVDSEFEITEHNNLGEGVYIYSPYNVVFLDYEYAAETMGFESCLPYGCTVFVDKFESIDQVGSELRELLGKDVDIYNTASDYLSNEAGVVVLMKNYSLLIFGYVSVIGGIVMLLILTFYAAQYRSEVGIFLALGCKKGRIVLQYGISMLLIIALAFFISGIVYHFTASTIVRSLNDIAKNVINYEDRSYGPYITPDLGQEFSLNLDIKEIVSVSNYSKIFFFSLGFLLLSMTITLYSIITTKPKFLLNKK